MDRLEDRFGGLENSISFLKDRISEPEGIIQNLQNG